MNAPRLLILSAALIVALADASAAQPDPATQAPRAEAPLPPKLWSDLNGQQQQVLAPARAIWDELAPDIQDHLAQAAQRWPKLTEAQRELLTRRIDKWVGMTPAQRSRLRERYEQFHQLPSDQQQRMLNAFRRFDALPEAERAQLREQFERMSPGERNAFLAGAGIQGHIGIFREVMLTVPPAERKATREMFEDFTPEQRQAFVKAWRSLPEEQRDGYRRQMLAMSPDQRSQALQPSKP